VLSKHSFGAHNVNATYISQHIGHLANCEDKIDAGITGRIKGYDADAQEKTAPPSCGRVVGRILAMLTSVLAGLDAIQWNNFHHAYGAASDVPDQLRALLSKHREARGKALYELFGNIWHQGTVYSATPVAVPFLIEIVTETTSADRADVLGLLGAIAESTDGPRTAHDEVARHADALRNLLRDSAPEVRAAAAYVLGQLAEHAAAIAPAIRATIERESDALARAGMLLALVPLGGTQPDDIAWLDRRFASTHDERERFAVAVALAHAAGAATADVVIDVLAMACTTPHANEKRFVGLSWDVNGSYLPREALVAAGQAAYRALPILLDQLLATHDGVTASFLLEDPLAIAFGPEPHSQLPRELDAHQHRVLVAVAGAGWLWTRPGLVGALFHEFGLPTTRDELLALTRR
jgi:hypothetical protein